MESETERRIAALERRLADAEDRLQCHEDIEAIKKLQRKLEMPTSLREYGVKADAFAQYKVEISEAALHDGCTPTNPRVPTAEELLKVLEKAF